MSLRNTRSMMVFLVAPVVVSFPSWEEEEEVVVDFS